jgi:hypothetical protein
MSTIPGSFSVFVDSSNRRGEGGRTYRALRVIVHPDYVATPNPLLIRADIAIIRTISRIEFGEFVQPIPLGREFVPSGSEVLLIGWGLTGNVKANLDLEHFQHGSIISEYSQ